MDNDLISIPDFSRERSITVARGHQLADAGRLGPITRDQRSRKYVSRKALRERGYPIPDAPSIPPVLGTNDPFSAKYLAAYDAALVGVPVLAIPTVTHALRRFISTLFDISTSTDSDRRVGTPQSGTVEEQPSDGTRAR